MEISDETYRLIELARTAPITELIGFEGNLEFPRPTLEEHALLHEDIRKIDPERLLVLLTYEGRLYWNQAAEDRYRAKCKALDGKIGEMLSKP